MSAEGEDGLDKSQGQGSPGLFSDSKAERKLGGASATKPRIDAPGVTFYGGGGGACPTLVPCEGPPQLTEADGSRREGSLTEIDLDYAGLAYAGRVDVRAARCWGKVGAEEERSATKRLP